MILSLILLAIYGERKPTPARPAMSVDEARAWLATPRPYTPRLGVKYSEAMQVLLEHLEKSRVEAAAAGRALKSRRSCQTATSCQLDPPRPPRPPRAAGVVGPAGRGSSLDELRLELAQLRQQFRSATPAELLPLFPRAAAVAQLIVEAEAKLRDLA